MEKQILPLLALRGKMVYPNTSVYFGSIKAKVNGSFRTGGKS